MDIQQSAKSLYYLKGNSLIRRHNKVEEVIGDNSFYFSDENILNVLRHGNIKSGTKTIHSTLTKKLLAYAEGLKEMDRTTIGGRNFALKSVGDNGDHFIFYSSKILKYLDGEAIDKAKKKEGTSGYKLQDLED